MVNRIRLIVRHEKGEIVQLVDDKGVHKFYFFNESKDISFFEKEIDKSREKIYIQQYHPLNSKFWWRSMLLPICFLQNYLLKYEYNFVDDYFAQSELLIIKETKNTDAEINLNMKKISQSKFVEKTFYFNLRKDSYLVSKVRPYYNKFELINVEGCKILNFKSDLPVSRRYLTRWKIVRLFPAVITYGALAAVALYEAFKPGDVRIPLILLGLVLLGLLFDIARDILTKKSRYCENKK